MKRNSFILRCNGKKKTGGPRATFQLAECLVAAGYSVGIWYDSLEAYDYFQDWHKKYLGEYSEFTISEKIRDCNATIFILTESSFDDINKLGADRRVWVYMQSVDNCIVFGTSASRFEGTLRILKNCFKSFPNSFRNRWGVVRHRIEFIFSQSAYSNNFLANLDSNIPYLYIGDFIDIGNYNEVQERARIFHGSDDRRIRVAFNPLKGRLLFKIARLFSRNIEYIEVANIDPSSIVEHLATADCYVDFGGQPGKDRLPREAIIAGIPAFQFLRGAAVNGSDFPCPQSFRLNFYNVFNLESKIRRGLKLNTKTVHAARLADVLSERTIFYTRVHMFLRTQFN